jgi:hypothetical protein
MNGLFAKPENFKPFGRNEHCGEITLRNYKHLRNVTKVSDFTEYVFFANTVYGIFYCLMSIFNIYKVEV